MRLPISMIQIQKSKFEDKICIVAYDEESGCFADSFSLPTEEANERKAVYLLKLMLQEAALCHTYIDRTNLGQEPVTVSDYLGMNEIKNCSQEYLDAQEEAFFQAATSECNTNLPYDAPSSSSSVKPSRDVSNHDAVAMLYSLPESPQYYPPGLLNVARYIHMRRPDVPAYGINMLLYYCQAWSLAWDKRFLFTEPIEAWSSGPRIPAFNEQMQDDSVLSQIPVAMPEESVKTIEHVLDKYANSPLSWLEECAKAELPYKNCPKPDMDGSDFTGELIDRKNEHYEITRDQMQQYYESRTSQKGDVTYAISADVRLFDMVRIKDKKRR